jgi:putative glycosyltransferase (TIGR04348 family)
MPQKLPTIHLITPALAEANNGNWQTAYRWGKFLAPNFEVITAKAWQAPSRPSESRELMIALHARRSAESIAAFAKTGQPIILVLTGTDLYRDIHHDAQAQRSLELADHLVVLHEQGAKDLPERFRSKTRTIFQSALKLKAIEPQLKFNAHRYFDIAMVGHVRAEKDPMTALRAMKILSAQPAAKSAKPIRLLHIGSDKDEALGRSFRDLASSLSTVKLLGSLSNARTRQWIKRCDVLVLPSVMEGGANVLIEAVMAGVPVIASRISGSVGMLGDDYMGYFKVTSETELAKLVGQCRDEPAFLAGLRAQCEQRAKNFEPALEKRLVNRLISEAFNA